MIDSLVNNTEHKRRKSMPVSLDLKNDNTESLLSLKNVESEPFSR